MHHTMLNAPAKCKVADCFVAIIQRNSKALNCDASKLLRLKYNYPRPVPPKSGPSLELHLCVCSLPQSLYNILLCECMFPCWTPTVACISCVIVCFHAGLPQSLYIILLC